MNEAPYIAAMAEFEFSSSAYCKMVLHAIKYPHANVLGLLAGEKRKGGGGWVIRDVFPLLHQAPGLALSTEAGLIQADALCASLGYTLVGVYHANENLRDVTRPHFVRRVAERLQANFSDAVLLTVENTQLGASCSEPCFSVWSFLAEAKGWEPKPRSSVRLESEEGTLRLAAAAVAAKLYRDLADFDAHLDNPAADFANPALAEKLRALA